VQPPGWYSSPDAIRIADNVVLHQRESGGWPKNINKAAVLTGDQKKRLASEKALNDSTIDNGATYTDLRYLARVYSATHLSRFRGPALAGIDYLLAAQYPNGGWPQFYPDLSGYYKHITFNDGAMIGALAVLNDAAVGSSEFAFVDLRRRKEARRAVQRGVQCILATQVVVDGKPTVWCAQYDETTLAPASARTYEVVSLCSAESAGIVRFLMNVEPQSARVIDAIESAVSWFRRSRIDGIRWITRRDPALERGMDRIVVEDPAAGPLWARFYEIGSNRPIFAGRDGIIRFNVAEIEAERRINYQWYVDAPATLLGREYREWRERTKREKSGRNSNT
jgi:PelA/Pel-15E family pectate lyase